MSCLPTLNSTSSGSKDSKRRFRVERHFEWYLAREQTSCSIMLATLGIYASSKAVTKLSWWWSSRHPQVWDPGHLQVNSEMMSGILFWLWSIHQVQTMRLWFWLRPTWTCETSFGIPQLAVTSRRICSSNRNFSLAQTISSWSHCLQLTIALDLKVLLKLKLEQTSQVPSSWKFTSNSVLAYC